MKTIARVQRRKRWYQVGVGSLLPVVLMLVACSSPAAPQGRAGCPAVGQLIGEGSTFDAPLFDKLFSVYPATPCDLSVVYYASGISQELLFQ